MKVGSAGLDGCESKPEVSLSRRLPAVCSGYRHHPCTSRRGSRHGSAFLLLRLEPLHRAGLGHGLARIPARLLSGISNMFEPAEPPNDIALPIDLDQIRLILVTVIRVAEPGAAKDLAVRQQLVWKSLQTPPQLDFLSIHIDEQGAEIRCRKNGVPAPRLGGIVQSDAGRIDRWMAHLSLLPLHTAPPRIGAVVEPRRAKNVNLPRYRAPPSASCASGSAHPT